MCPLYILVHTRNLNGSRHKHYATGLNTDDLTVLPPSAPSNHGIGPRSFPPRTAVGTVGMVACTIAAYFAVWIIQEEGGGYLVARSPLWPIVIRKLCEQLSLNPYSVHGGIQEQDGATTEKKDQTNIAPSSPPTQGMK